MDKHAVSRSNDWHSMLPLSFFFFQAEDGIRDSSVTGVQTCALPISLLQTLVARVEVVAARERSRRGAEELVVQAVDGAGRVAEHAVDAFAELAELIDLIHGLAVLAGAKRQFLLADDPWLDGLQLVHEVLHVDDEVAHDREVLQRLGRDGARPGIPQ